VRTATTLLEILFATAFIVVAGPHLPDLSLSDLGIPFPFGLAILLTAFGATLLCAWYFHDRPRALLHRQVLRMNHGLCPECGYDLTGNASGVCPECGEQLAPLRLTAPPRESGTPRVT